MVWVCLVLYLGIFVFVIASVVRAVRFARLPMHLRWELYPVPHEEAQRAAHGGSYFEQTDWWMRPRHVNRLGELKAMLPEMLLLKGLWEFNRALWLRSFPFHFGLYLLAGAVSLVATTALADMVVPTLLQGFAGSLVHGLYTFCGGAGWLLTTVGALGLLHRRLTDASIRAYTVPADIFNLLAFVVTLAVIGIALSVDRGPGVRAIAAGLLTFDRSVPVPRMLAAGLMLGALLVAYIPLTHMSHFIAKYFTYHAVRWDDAVSVRGGKLETRMAKYLTYRPTWSAAHVGADGRKTWAAVAASKPAGDVKK